MRKENVLKGIVLLACLFLLLPSSVLAQCCEADFDNDGNVYPSDLTVFLGEYGKTDCVSCGDGEICAGGTCVPCNITYSPGAHVPKTGQTTSYATGDDGDLEMGVIWPFPRFTNNGDGTVTDNLTGLIWLKDANCFGTGIWNTALSYCNGLASGSCGLTDGSIAGDWRLPNRFELESLLDLEYYNPAVPNTAGTGQWSEGNPFTNVQSDYYRSSTTGASSTDHAWIVHMGSGSLFGSSKDNYTYYVWPVRSDN